MIAVVANDIDSGLNHIRTLIKQGNMSFFDNNAGIVRTKDDKIYKVVTADRHVYGYEFEEMIIVPNYESFVDRVRSRIRK